MTIHTFSKAVKMAVILVLVAPLAALANEIGENVVRNGDFEDPRMYVGNDYRYSANDTDLLVCPEWTSTTRFAASKTSNTYCVPSCTGCGKYIAFLRENSGSMQQDVELNKLGVYTFSLTALKGYQYDATAGELVVELVKDGAVIEVLRVGAAQIATGWTVDFTADVTITAGGTYTLLFRQENPSGQTTCETCIDNVSLVLSQMDVSTLVVESDTAEFAADGLPAYGSTSGHQFGETVTLTAPSQTLVMSDNLKVYCAGWEVLNAATGDSVGKGSGTTCSFSFPDHSVRVRWKWALTISTKPGYTCEFLPGGYRRDNDLQGFPLLVRISPSRIPGFAYADVASQQDLVFVDVEGHMLPYEVEHWNPEGESCVWVKLNSLRSGRDNRVFLGWKNAKGVVNDPLDVWSEYSGVWHFEADSAEQPDSSASGIPLTLVEGATGTSGSGMVGNALNKTGSANSPTDFIGASGMYISSFAVSGWFYWPEHTPSVSYASLVKLGEYGEDSWYLEYMSSSDIITLVLKSNMQKVVTGSAKPESGWVHYVAAFNGDTFKVYFNGAECFAYGCRLQKSEQPLQVSAYKGWVDETRVRNIASSADWVWAEYKQVVDSDFVTATPAKKTASRGMMILFQ